MRMHKKGHLEQRLENCGEILTVCDLLNKNMKTAVDKKEYLDFNSIFKNTNPVRVEIGCGKGKFICELAAKQKNVNFVAVEKVSNVIIDACERAVREKIENVYFINSAAEVLQKYFKPHTVEKIYLNFSNPLPKEGYKKQRLTHPKFLKIYREILISGGEIIQKTDDEAFFDFSLESYKSEGFEIVEICRDLKSNPVEGDVITEHEAKFMSEGKKIFRAAVRVK